MIVSSPGIKRWYPSYMCSRWYCWFVELGYENLDIVQHRDTFQMPDGSYLTAENGTWSIIQYYNTPIIPAETRWNFVIANINDHEINPSFVERMVHMVDIKRKEYWDLCEEKTRKMEAEKDYLERHAQDVASRATDLIMRTPTVVERIAKNGLKEMDPVSILKHIPRHQKNGLKGVELK